MMFRPNRRTVLAGAAAAASLALPGIGRAQSYPTKPITFVCPFPAGGIVDLVMRSFSGDLAAELGQPVVVDPRPGAGGMIASTAVAKAEADGHTLMMATLSHLVAPLLSKAEFHPIDDFQAIAVCSSSVSVVCVPTSVKANNLAELIALAKANPGKLNYLRPGHGSFGHLTVETIKLNAGVDITPVDYRGLPPGILDMLADRVQVGILSSGLAAPHVRDGKMRVIGTVGATRAKEFPDVPSLTEQGFADANLDSWYMVVAPKGVPAPVIEKLNATLSKVLAKPDVQARLITASGIPVPPLTPDAAQALLVKDFAKYQTLVREAKITGQ
jgi:tripartite-type tricarboxylate transporter receptor subunit TctC